MDDKQKEEIVQIIKRMPSYIKLIYMLYRDKDVPGKSKVALSAALGYNISPVDLIPGFIPAVGQIDNVYFTLKLLRRSLKACPEDVAKKHLENSNITMESLNKDIEASGRLMREVGKTALKTSGMILKKSASTVYKFGKSILTKKEE